jgi:predicted dehydrogenase
VKESTAATDAQTPLRVGVLGAGGIATIPEGVLPNMHHITDKATVVAVADLLEGRAEEAAAQFGIPEHYSSLDDMLANAGLDAVVNLTPIPAHAETSIKIVEAGKHLAVEKPLATTLAEADAIIDAARARELTIICAPPDMLYSPYVQARNLIREDVIGKVAFARVRSSHAGPGGGPAGWPFDPTWFYQDGSGPLLDMGVYGIHEITGLLGPAKRVTAFAGITEPTRVVRGGPHAGLEIPVTTPDNCLFMLDFGEATFAVVDGTFNVHASRSPKVEVFGRKGAMALFRTDGPDLEVYRTDVAPGVDGWIAPSHWPAVADPRREMLKRALLVDHLADCVRERKAPVLSAEHARHALEVMLAAFQSAREGRVIELTTTF